MIESYINTLAEANLFVLRSSQGHDHHLIYAPLADSVFVASEDDIKSLSGVLSGENYVKEDYRSVIAALSDVCTPDKREGYISDEADFINLSILPNNTCNFSCSYCYSAKGRSSARMTYDMARTMILYFLDSRSRTQPLLTFSFFGGGEPLLSWKDVVLPSIELIASECKRREQKHIIILITNGSMIPDGFMEVCREYKIDLVVSFDILEDVQNSQRRNYDLVSKNIAALIDTGVVPAVNAVVTPLNVCRQAEMVEYMHIHFPEIRHLAFEPMMGDVKDHAAFYKAFSTSFLDASAIADGYGMSLSCTALRNVDVTVDRYCPGEMALCADGSISICPCVSSPKEPNYNEYIYGRVKDSGVEIDHNRLAELLSENIYTRERCRNCFAKWNCGGGCMNENRMAGKDKLAAYCTFVRNFTRYIITSRLDKIYEENGDSLKELIGDYEYIVR